MTPASTTTPTTTSTSRWRHALLILRRAVDSWAHDPGAVSDASDRPTWRQALPFVWMHVMCLGVIWVGVSPAALVFAGLLFAVRMFAITAFYHRYFSHRAFETSRFFQFVMGFLGTLALQRGPLWWAAHHRIHHRESDTPADPHSYEHRGFTYSHMGWFLAPRSFGTRLSAVRDLARYRELRFLDRFDIFSALALAAFTFSVGSVLDHAVPSLGVSGAQFLVWGFFVSTVVLYHATYTINSLCHRFGRQRYATGDQSRNNFWLALLTFGEGWHNNHHRYPSSARQGFRWWEIDLSYYGLWLLERCGLIWNLRPVPERVLRDGAPHRELDARVP